MTEIYEHFKKDGRGTILNGWKAAGVNQAVQDARNGTVLNFTPFA